VTGPGEDPAAEVVALGQAIDPRHGIVVAGIAGCRQSEKLLEIAERDGLRSHVRTGDRHQLQGGTGDDARKAEAANRGSKQPRGIIIGNNVLTAIAAQQGQTADPASKRTGAVVVLAMHVIGNGAAESHEFGAGGHWQKEAGGNGEFQHFCQADASLGFQQAAGPIEADKAVEAGYLDQGAAVVEAAVAIGPPQSTGQ
jgi:hypothetical protein